MKLWRWTKIEDKGGKVTVEVQAPTGAMAMARISEIIWGLNSNDGKTPEIVIGELEDLGPMPSEGGHEE